MGKAALQSRGGVAAQGHTTVPSGVAVKALPAAALQVVVTEESSVMGEDSAQIRFWYLPMLCWVVF